MERVTFYKMKISEINLIAGHLEFNACKGNILDAESDIINLRQAIHLIEHELYRGI